MMNSGCDRQNGKRPSSRRRPGFRRSFGGGMAVSVAVGVLTLAASSLDIPSFAVADVRAQDKTVRDGVYSDAQADRGAKLFGQFCSGCHGPERFVGEQMKPWTGQTADVLFDAVRLNMPEDRPGSLTRQQYADVLSYIFRLNGFVAGTNELAGTDDEMKSIRIEGR